MPIKTIRTKHSEAVLYRTENLERYLREILKEKSLNKEEEREFLILAKQGNQGARDRLTKANLKFVVSCAKEYQKQKFELMDLISAGNEGLIEAIEKYDMDRDLRFISYAVWRIKAKIIEFIRVNVSIIQLPLNQQNEITKLEKLKEELENQEHCELTYSQIIESHNDISYKFSSIRDALESNQEISSMDNVYKDDSLAQTYICKDSSLTERTIFQDERKKILNSVLQKLPETQRQVLTLSFGLEDGITRTNEDIALYLKKNAENIRQIKTKGLKALGSFKILKELV